MALGFASLPEELFVIALATEAEDALAELSSAVLSAPFVSLPLLLLFLFVLGALSSLLVLLSPVLWLVLVAKPPYTPPYWRASWLPTAAPFFCLRCVLAARRRRTKGMQGHVTGIRGRTQATPRVCRMHTH